MKYINTKKNTQKGGLPVKVIKENINVFSSRLSQMFIL